ncbi:hypothetical protein [Lysinibacillus capsici]|uniref:hypothetical protein n=1 Tax=Lysinibacillus capsici TaxID=2115968 RepID=UPI000E20B88B|nr:hypothetical protein [Lysinibacillus capsici]RDV27118.1 hypothetical protein C7B89_19975 [Lysinibacillus capsici]
MAEKVVKIYDKEVKFKVTGATPILYMSMFGSDFLKDFMELEKAQAQGESPSLLPLYRIAYALAKKADDSLPDMEAWLDSFEDGFPVADVVKELMPLIQMNFTTNAPKKTNPKK